MPCLCLSVSPSTRLPCGADAASARLSDDQKHRVITQLHSVLRPFLLRRTKEEVGSSSSLAHRQT